MRRIENWDSALVRYAETVLGEAFKWGRTDCAAVVRNGLNEILGLDPWKGHVEVWRSKVKALRIASSLDAEVERRFNRAASQRRDQLMLWLEQ